MRSIGLLYHDVVEADLAQSGFAGIGADRYKLRRAEFEAHLVAIAAASTQRATSVLAPPDGNALALYMTFDDGGSGALVSADMLERRGWRGHYFIVTDLIGKEGFLDADGIRDLEQRGHVIGSHSCSHPDRIDLLDDGALRREWERSAEVLAEVTGVRPLTASIPCGTYTRRVAEAAAAAGYAHLFTSEPVTTAWRIGGCLVHGRYSIVRGTTPQEAGALAAGSLTATGRQLAMWNAKKALKVAARPLWNVLRGRALEARKDI
jgi:hypothetical protein